MLLHNGAPNPFSHGYWHCAVASGLSGTASCRNWLTCVYIMSLGFAAAAARITSVSAGCPSGQGSRLKICRRLSASWVRSPLPPWDFFLEGKLLARDNTLRKKAEHGDVTALAHSPPQLCYSCRRPFGGMETKPRFIHKTCTAFHMLQQLNYPSAQT